MYKPRKNIEVLLGHLQKERIVILLGARQVGKTTLLKMLQERLPQLQPSAKIHYWTMESPSALGLLSSGTAGLNQAGVLNTTDSLYLLIDEFQYLNNPNQLFKEIYDTYANVSIVASGSSSLEIQQKIHESLAGRKLTMHVYPLDFYEYCQFTLAADEARDVAKLFDETLSHDLLGSRLGNKKFVTRRLATIFQEFVLFGGLPHVVLENGRENKQQQLEEIITTYIQKDIKGILKDIEIAAFNRLIQLVTSQIGNMLNVAELENTLRLKRREVEHYLQVLRETFVNFLLKPYATNKRTEVTKTPKTFFYDNGVRNQILRQFSALELRADAGALLENAIYLELQKNLHISEELYYWRTKNVTEVDFVLRMDEHLFPIEAKLGSQKTIPPSIRSFSESHNVQHAFILNLDEWSSVREGKTAYHFLPHFLAHKIPGWAAPVK